MHTYIKIKKSMQMKKKLSFSLLIIITGLFLLLNTIGEYYFQLGEPREALTAWQKSLVINQNQPQIKKSVEALKEKK